jgi:hypothetical protein
MISFLLAPRIFFSGFPANNVSFHSSGFDQAFGFDQRRIFPSGDYRAIFEKLYL